MSSEKVNLLLKAVKNASQIVILTHTNPDPDAIGSAVALRYLLAEKLNIEGQIVYQGLIGRAENKALVRYLVHPLRPLAPSDLTQGTALALVDTQPGSGNTTPVPADADIAIVVDHHAGLRELPETGAAFVDIRPEVGATSTILTEYLQAAGLEPPIPLATALFYGIKTNTMSLGRNAHLADAMAYNYLQPQIDVKGLAGIEQARVPANYFKSFDVALRAARVYDGILISFMGPVGYPDLPAEMADLLLRLEESEWVICLGVYGNDLMFSVRLHRGLRGAGQLAQVIAGPDGTAGGHGTIAGGQIPLGSNSAETLLKHLVPRILEQVGRPLDLSGNVLFE